MDRDRLEALVERGLTVRQIAAEVERSPTTVRRWLRRHGLATLHHGPGRTAAAAGEPVRRHCARHGVLEFVFRTDHYRCPRCISEAVARRRRRVKEILVDEAGGRCVICGYDRYAGALHFHHVDPAEKSFGLGIRGLTRSLAAMREEARKCVLLCGVCHPEVEAGLKTLPEGVGTVRSRFRG